MKSEQNIIIYNTADGKAKVALYAKDGNIWMNQNQIAKLFATSVPNISMHISNILKEGELEQNSVIKDYLTTASDGKEYNVTFYSLDRLVVVFLESAELRAKNRMDFTMDFWRENVDKILKFQDKKILTKAGSISKTEMEKHVREIYSDFDKRRKEYEALQADKDDIEELKQIENEIKRNTHTISNNQ